MYQLVRGYSQLCDAEELIRECLAVTVLVAVSVLRLLQLFVCQTCLRISARLVYQLVRGCSQLCDAGEPIRECLAVAVQLLSRILRLLQLFVSQTGLWLVRQALAPVAFGGAQGMDGGQFMCEWSYTLGPKCHGDDGDSDDGHDLGFVLIMTDLTTTTNCCSRNDYSSIRYSSSFRSLSSHTPPPPL